MHELVDTTPAVSSTSTVKPPQRLFIPGPTDVLPAVLAAQTAPMIGHRSDEFEALFAKCEGQLQRLFETRSRVFIVVASGSGLQEAAIRNCVGGRVVCFVNGAFSQRWHDVAVGCDKQVTRVDVAWNTAVKPQVVAEALRKALAEGPVDAITVVHNETSTGVTSPVAEIAAAVRAVSPDTLVLVDAVSSFGGTRIPVDAWGIDVLLTSSQKALALPPGLSFCSASDRVLERAKQIKGRGWYFDFLNLEKSLQKNTTPATPAISLMRGLSLQLDLILAEGSEQRYAAPCPPGAAHAGLGAGAGVRPHGRRRLPFADGDDRHQHPPDRRRGSECLPCRRADGDLQRLRGLQGQSIPHRPHG